MPLQHVIESNALLTVREVSLESWRALPPPNETPPLFQAWSPTKEM